MTTNNDTAAIHRLSKLYRRDCMILGYLVRKESVSVGKAAAELGVSLTSVVNVAESHQMTIDVAISSGNGIFNFPMREWIITHE